MKLLLVGILTLGAVVAQGGANGSREPAGTPAATGQQPAAKTGANDEGGARSISSVDWRANGWPVVHGDPAPAGETGANAASRGDAGTQRGDGGSDPGEARPWADGRRGGEALPAANGLDSPLLAVFRATRSPGMFRQIGGIQVWWQLTTYGPSGEIRGTRNLTQITDCARPARDRLEMPNGDVYTRSGDRVGAQRDGIPYDRLQTDGKAYLELFGMHVRLPWCFGSAPNFAIVKREVGELEGSPLNRMWLSQRPDPNEEVFGPMANPKPRDQFMLGFEPSTGLPRELEHRFVGMGRRRVLLDDWKEVYGVNWPHTRIYVDERGQKTTVLTIQRLRRLRVSEADFRQL